MSSFVERLADQLPEETLGDHRLVLAVSGGADSTAMLRGVVELASRRQRPLHQIIVAHYHHGLRKAADADAAFVQELCQSLGVACLLGKATQDEIEIKPADGQEARARELRYDFLIRCAQDQMARYLLTAHTADDQSETVLFRALRGTGWRGLAGIPAVSQLRPGLTLWRPMLSIERTDVTAYLASQNQGYCHDETNEQDLFTRNRLRNEVFPLLDDVMGRSTRPHLARLAQQMQRWQQWMDVQVDRWQQQCVTLKDPQQLVVDLEALGQHASSMHAEIFRSAWRHAGWPQQAMTEAHWSGLVEFAAQRADPANWQLPHGVRVERRGTQLWLTRTVDA